VIHIHRWAKWEDMDDGTLEKVLSTLCPPGAITPKVSFYLKFVQGRRCAICNKLQVRRPSERL
jgi:hypothetical protein